MGLVRGQYTLEFKLGAPRLVKEASNKPVRTYRFLIVPLRGSSLRDHVPLHCGRSSRCRRESGFGMKQRVANARNAPSKNACSSTR